MATAVQDQNGKWTIKGLKWEREEGKVYPENLSFTGTVLYNGVPAKGSELFTISETEHADIETNWETKLGSPLSVSKLKVSCPDVTRKVGNEWFTYTAVENFKETGITPFDVIFNAKCNNVTPGGGAVNTKISITSNTKWSITVSDPSWITVNPLTGTGNNSNVTVRYEANPSTNPRSATIKITCGNKEKVFEITQAGLTPTISVTATTPVPATATTISYTATSNVDNVIVKYDTQTRTTKVGTFNIPVNKSPEHSVNHVITAACEDYPSVTATTTVKQNEAEYRLSISPTSFTFDDTGGTKSLSITDPDGYRWEIANLPEWITANPTAGTASQTVDLTAGANTEGSQRTGTFKVKDKTNTETTRESAVTCTQIATKKTPEIQSFDISFESDTPSTISLSPVAMLAVPFTGKTKDLNITSNTTWRVKSCPDWVTLSEMSGNGNKTLTVTIAENTSSESRTGMIDVWTTDETTRATCQVTQDGVPNFSFEVRFKQPVNWGSYDGKYTAHTGSGEISGTYTYNGTSDSLIFGNNQIKNGDRVVHWIYNYTGYNFKIAQLYDYEEPTPKETDFVNFNDHEGRGFECNNAEYGKKLYIFLRNQ